MNFWQHHGWLFLFGCAIFPRITMAIFSSMTFGLWSILGWIFVPHVLVAILATTFYWHTDTALVVIAWLFAFGGTSGEGKLASRR